MQGRRRQRVPRGSRRHWSVGHRARGENEESDVVLRRLKDATTVALRASGRGEQQRSWVLTDGAKGKIVFSKHTYQHMDGGVDRMTLGDKSKFL